MTKGLQTAVIGAGLMGHGIALTLARAGHNVAITDPVPDALASVTARITDSLKLLEEPAGNIPKILKKIALCNSVEGAVKDAGFVIEAAPEKLDLKRSIFSEIEAHAPTDAVLASNTSVIQISKITGHLESRHRALGTHWWNPPHMIPLVEVVKTEWTAPAAAQAMFDLLAEAGKTPVMVEKDVPGFIGNRLQHALWREAVSLVENGICDAEAVDTVIKASFGRRLVVLGPLENADLVGTDLTLDIHENVLADLERRPGPSPYLQQLVSEGRLGMKTGEGFRKWADGDAEKIRDKVGRHLQQLQQTLGD
ncbi:MAG: 3-hydroxyacyl-CoA dehydrogenase family protein [Rhodobacteraceae bacterium]|nr:3-hydroxyacyl-CoA dehydrogenase family protein [Paracoccaceae bacterium]